MIEKAKLIDIREDGTATFQCKVNIDRFMKWKIKEAYIEPIDSRQLSDEQRKMCYAMMKEIADYLGYSANEMKATLKLQYQTSLCDTLNDRLFSLSNAPMSLVANFQKYLIEFILEWNVPTSIPLYEYAEDINHYIYMCIINKKCAVCGKRAELHHIEAVGIGRDREEICHIGMEAISLCREHHTEAHTIGNKEFMSRYHFDGGVKIDGTIAKIYKLRAKE